MGNAWGCGVRRSLTTRVLEECRVASCGGLVAHARAVTPRHAPVLQRHTRCIQLRDVAFSYGQTLGGLIQLASLHSPRGPRWGVRAVTRTEPRNNAPVRLPLVALHWVARKVARLWVTRCSEHITGERHWLMKPFSVRK